MGVDRQVLLRFGAPGTALLDMEDLSAAHWDGHGLWLAGDELPRFERLAVKSGDSSYGEHRSFLIGDFVELPAGAEKEVDAEGVDRQGDYLWLVGSHSRSRKRVDPHDLDNDAVEDLAKVRDHPNRQVLIRIALAQDGDEVIPAQSTVAATGAVLTSAVLNAELTTALGSDEHFSLFVGIPSKDNGLDVEGLVAFEDRILLGLRGPVLRGWAAVVEVKPLQDPADPTRLTLGSPPYRKHFLDLGGLGVRDLCRDGDDVLVLAGPTMDLDGPVRVYRWHDAGNAQDVEIVSGDQITLATELPFGDGDDHAEGITLVSTDGGPTGLLVVYDSPAPARRVGAGVLLADIVAIPEPGQVGA